jgi:hypothetical protein
MAGTNGPQCLRANWSKRFTVSRLCGAGAFCLAAELRLGVSVLVAVPERPLSKARLSSRHPDARKSCASLHSDQVPGWTTVDTTDFPKIYRVEARSIGPETCVDRRASVVIREDSGGYGRSPPGAFVPVFQHSHPAAPRYLVLPCQFHHALLCSTTSGPGDNAWRPSVPASGAFAGVHARELPK